jgi:hypothetical protein
MVRVDSHAKKRRETSVGRWTHKITWELVTKTKGHKRKVVGLRDICN